MKCIHCRTEIHRVVIEGISFWQHRGQMGINDGTYCQARVATPRVQSNLCNICNSSDCWRILEHEDPLE